MIESILHFLCVLEIRFLVSTFPLTNEIFMTQIKFELPQSVIQVSPVKVTAVTKSGPLCVYLYTHVRQHGKTWQVPGPRNEHRFSVCVISSQKS